MYLAASLGVIKGGIIERKRVKKRCSRADSQRPFLLHCYSVERFYMYTVTVTHIWVEYAVCVRMCVRVCVGM